MQSYIYAHLNPSLKPQIFGYYCAYGATTWNDFWLMANEERLSASPRLQAQFEVFLLTTKYTKYTKIFLGG